MKDRFTHRSRLGRGSIPRGMRFDIYKRDNYTCQFCKVRFTPIELTIDHVVPISLGGLDEITNYVTCCKSCNQLKANIPISEFAKTININIVEIPVHGDPIIDNKALPIQIRLLRKSLFDKHRQEEAQFTGRGSQKKLEKKFRREFWLTPLGKALEADYSSLPGQARIMIPEIQTIAKNPREFWLLVELSKSANTRNLIGSILTPDCDIERRVYMLEEKTKDEALRNRLRQAMTRFRKEIKKRENKKHLNDPTSD